MSDVTIENPLGRLIQFLDQLEEHTIHYDLKHVRDSIMVLAYVAEGYWKIEFFEDGTVEVERFRREGPEGVPTTWLDQFIEKHTD